MSDDHTGERSRAGGADEQGRRQPPQPSAGASGPDADPGASYGARGVFEEAARGAPEPAVDVLQEAARGASGAGKEEPGRLPGPRRSARERRRHTRRRSVRAELVLGCVGAVAAVAVLVAVGLRVDDPAPSGVAVRDATRLEREAVSATLLVGTRVIGAESEVAWMTLLSYDRAAGRGGVVYIPAHTAAEVPGRGLQGLSDAFSSGDMTLLAVGTENLLDVAIDHHLELSESDARTLLDEIDPLTVDVPAEVRVAAGGDRARLVFSEGPQRLSAAYLEQLLYLEGLDEDDAELGSRHLAFWDALFETFADDPDALEDAVLQAEDALDSSDAAPSLHAALFHSLARLPDSARTLGVLPVKQISGAGEELYEVDQAEASELLALAAHTAEPDQQQSVQVLNGNGVPGIGQEVGRRLVGNGFRVILSGNARRLDYPRTLIIAYDSSPEALAAARRARDLLGVGQVQVSTQSQGIVNLTVVVGKDFLDRE